MYTWTMVNREVGRFGELTWSGREVEVVEAPLGAEGTPARHGFSSANELQEFVEDWLEAMRIDGFVELGPGEQLPAVAAPAPLPADVLARALAARSAGADEDDDDDDDEDDDNDRYYDNDWVEPEADAEPLLHDDDVDEEAVTESLSLDQALEVRSKETPFDLETPVDPSLASADDPDAEWERDNGLQIIDRLDD